jgi:plastocyanin
MKMNQKMLIIISLTILLLIVGCDQKEIVEENSIEEVNDQEIVISTEEQVQQNEDLVEEELVEVEIQEPKQIITLHEIKIDENGFVPEELTINVGDIVEWTNIREGSLKIAQISGSQQCVNIKSPLLQTGEKFTWTFDEVEECTIVEIITTHQVGKIKIK